jgi:uncharacterized protein (TIGR03083 family)
MAEYQGDAPDVPGTVDEIPRPPATLAEQLTGFEECIRSLLRLGRGATPEELQRPTACPGWTVQDQLAHVAGLESLLAGDPQPTVEVPAYPWLRSPVGTFIEQSVEARRGRAAAAVLGELDAVTARRLATLRSPDVTDDTLIRGIMGGEAPAKQVMRIRLTDVWCHEQDVREALGRPGGMTSYGAAGFVSVVLDSLPRIVARDASVPIGHTVVITVSGPVIASRAIRVEDSGDGRPRGVEADAEAAHGPDVTRITMDTRSLTRRGAGRIATAETAYEVVGDAAIAQRVLDHLAVTP